MLVKSGYNEWYVDRTFWNAKKKIVLNVYTYIY